MYAERSDEMSYSYENKSRFDNDDTKENLSGILEPFQ